MKNFLKVFMPIICCIVVAISCKKSSSEEDKGNNPPTSKDSTSVSTSTAYDSTYNPVDAAVTNTQGFFLDDWSAKSFTVPSNYNMQPSVTTAATDTVKIDANAVVTKISKYLFGENANVWMGQIVTQPTLMKYITDLSPNIIRGPGGSTSDIYFWNTSTNPSDVPANLLDANFASNPASYWGGKNTQTWTMTIDNYYTLLQQTNSAGIQTINYGYARYGTSANPVATAAHLAADWVRYDKGRTKFWEIGNENYGSWESGYNIDVSQNKDGQPATLTATLYGQHFLVFVDSMRKAAAEVGASIKIGAQLSDALTTNVPDWNKKVLAVIGNNADFFIIHDYYAGYQTNDAAAEILNDAISVASASKTYLTSNIPSNNANLKPLAMTEFNIQSQGSRQQTSFVNGMAAVLTVGELMKNQFGEVSRWDLANAYSNGDDMGMFANTSGSDIGPGETDWNPRPVFYTKYYFQKFLGDRLVASASSNPDIVAYSSTFASSNNIASVIVNKGTTDRTVDINIVHFPMGTKFYYYTLKGGTDNGEFSPKVYVNGTGPSGAIGGPLNYATIAANASYRSGNNIKLLVPARSIVYLAVDKQ